MEQDSIAAAKRSNHSSGDGDVAGNDRLSALPDDVLVLILSHLWTPEAAQTSVLSRRWRRVWALLPTLWFRFAPEPYRFRDFLAAGEVPLSDLSVDYKDADPESLSVWLPAAARRVSDISLRLGLLGLAVPPAGVFAQLTILFLNGIRFHGGWTPGGWTPRGLTVSSPRCPCLKMLSISDTRGLDSLTVDSKSLM